MLRACAVDCERREGMRAVAVLETAQFEDGNDVNDCHLLIVLCRVDERTVNLNITTNENW